MDSHGETAHWGPYSMLKWVENLGDCGNLTYWDPEALKDWLAKVETCIKDVGNGSSWQNLHPKHCQVSPVMVTGQGEQRSIFHQLLDGISSEESAAVEVGDLASILDLEDTEDTRDIINCCVEYYYRRWKVSEEPKLVRQAHVRWVNAQQNLVKQQQMYQTQLKLLKSRGREIETELIRKHTNKAELVFDSAILGQAVYRFAECQWKMALFTQTEAPLSSAELEAQEAAQVQLNDYTFSDIEYSESSGWSGSTY